jgi:hypothetical protein
MPESESSKSWRKKRSLWREEQGLCRRCGGERDNPERKTCSKCLADSKRISSARYNKFKEAGLCVWCGVRPPDNGRVDCDPCHEVHKKPEGYDKPYNERTRKKLREDVLRAYGESCACCGESEPRFLQIDHINNDGKAHRTEIGTSGLYRWLKKNGYPEGFQTLCANCNLGKHLNGGVCPHSLKRSDRL